MCIDYNLVSVVTSNCIILYKKKKSSKMLSQFHKIVFRLSHWNVFFAQSILVPVSCVFSIYFIVFKIYALLIYSIDFESPDLMDSSKGI